MTKPLIKSFTTLSVFIFTLVFVSQTRAALEDDTSPGGLRFGNRCETVTIRTQNKLANFDNNKQRHMEKYNKLKEKFAEIIDKLKDEGYNVSKLENDAVILNEKIQKFSNDYSTFTKQLGATQMHACGESEGAFLSALRTSKEQLKVLREDVRDIKAYYRTVIRADIIDLKNQK